jgi:lipoprotein-releasing system permease protein
MPRSAPLFLALRYLQPKRSFVSIITLISVLGIMLGVGVLIVVISVMTGFEIEFKKLLLGFEPHVILQQYEPLLDEEGKEIGTRTPWQQVRNQLKEKANTKSVTPFAAGMIFIKTSGKPMGIETHAFDPNDAPDVVEKLQKLIVKVNDQPQGSFDLSSSSNIVLATSVANEMGILIGDKVTVYASSNLKEVFERFDNAEQLTTPEAKAKAYDEMDEFVVRRELNVVGIIRGEDAGNRSFVALDVGAELMDRNGRVRAIGLELNDAHTASDYSLALRQELPDDWRVESWMERWQSRLAAIQNERIMMYFVLIFVILVAAFSVMNTTITVTVQKRREIGILRALGASVKQIVSIFMLQALIVAVMGTLCGWLGGLTFLHFRNHIRSFLADSLGMDIFPADIYALSSIPSHTVPEDVALICGTSLVLCLLGAFLPAILAAKVDPAVALRD